MNLICSVQYYDWGSREPNCNVYTIAVQNDTNKSTNISLGKLDKPHAEFWIGTHVNGPSIIQHSNQLLSDYVAENPQVLGDKLVDKFGKELPFLLKILSVNKPLSIQAHPNKKHAEELHAKFPDIYKDGNHKPEMLITLTDFHMLRGFRSIQQIQMFLKCVPELRGVLGDSICEGFISCNPSEGREHLKRAYKALMTAPDQLVKHALDSILKRTPTMDEATRGSYLADLLESLHSHFPGDVGCLSVYFLQDYHMKPGEVAFLPANQIHAYIHGECIEIMACSDNVVRGGLTPKLKDVETLCAMLDYDTAEASNLEKIVYADNCVKYIPHGITDFAITHIQVESNSPKVTVASNGCASVVLAMGPAEICIEGVKSCEIRRGQVFFINAQQSVTLAASPWLQEGDISHIIKG